MDRLGLGAGLPAETASPYDTSDLIPSIAANSKKLLLKISSKDSIVKACLQQQEEHDRKVKEEIHSYFNSVKVVHEQHEKAFIQCVDQIHGEGKQDYHTLEDRLAEAEKTLRDIIVECDLIQKAEPFPARLGQELVSKYMEAQRSIKGWEPPQKYLKFRFVGKNLGVDLSMEQYGFMAFTDILPEDLCLTENLRERISAIPFKVTIQSCKPVDQELFKYLVGEVQYPNGRSTVLDLECCQGNTINAVVTPGQQGSHIISLKLYGLHIQGSPRTFPVIRECLYSGKTCNGTLSPNLMESSQLKTPIVADGGSKVNAELSPPGPSQKVSFSAQELGARRMRIATSEVQKRLGMSNSCHQQQAPVSQLQRTLLPHSTDNASTSLGLDEGSSGRSSSLSTSTQALTQPSAPESSLESLVPAEVATKRKRYYVAGPNPSVCQPARVDLSGANATPFSEVPSGDHLQRSSSPDELIRIIHRKPHDGIGGAPKFSACELGGIKKEEGTPSSAAGDERQWESCASTAPVKLTLSDMVSLENPVCSLTPDIARSIGIAAENRHNEGNMAHMSQKQKELDCNSSKSSKEVARNVTNTSASTKDTREVTQLEPKTRELRKPENIQLKEEEVKPPEPNGNAKGRTVKQPEQRRNVRERIRWPERLVSRNSPYLFTIEALLSAKRTSSIQGRLIGIIGGGQDSSHGAEELADLDHPIGVEITSKGNIIVADTGHDCLKLFQNTGKLIRVVNQPKSALRRPSAITMVWENTFAIRSDWDVSYFTLEGEYIAGVRPSDLKKPFGLTKDSRGNLVTIDVQYSGPLLCFIDRGLVTKRVPLDVSFNNMTWLRSKPRFLTCHYDPITDRNFFAIVDLGVDQVLLADECGTVYNIIGRTGQGIGQFRDPSGATFDPSGHLLVADSRNHRIQVFRPGGGFLTVLELDVPPNRPSGIALSDEGVLAVANYWGNSVHLYQLM